VFRALIAIFICLFASGASTEPSVEDKLCIFSAAQKLPAIPGLEITSSRVKSLPPEQRRRAEKTSKVSSVKVEIDIKAAGQEGTYEFVCSGAPGGTVFVTPTGVSGRYPLENSPARPIGNSPR
jgi:hypothetical protein